MNKLHLFSKIIIELFIIVTLSSCVSFGKTEVKEIGNDGTMHTVFLVKDRSWGTSGRSLEIKTPSNYNINTKKNDAVDQAVELVKDISKTAINATSKISPTV